MTNEPDSLVERHIEKTGMAFAVAQVSGASLDRGYGVKGFPTSFLVDARGRIAWSGHPAQLGEKRIQKLLKGSTFIAPLGDKSLSKIDKLLTKQEYGKADAALAKALASNPDDERLTATRAAIARVGTVLLKEAAAADEQGLYGFASELYSEAETLLDGLEQADAARAARELIEDNPRAKDELKAYELLQAGLAYIAKGDDKRAKGKLQSAAKWLSTPSGREAKGRLRTLK